MAKVTTAELVNAAKELTKSLGIKPAIEVEVKNVTDKDLIESLTSASEMFEAGDTFSKETTATLKKLKLEVPSKAKDEESDDEDEVDEDEVDEDEVDEDEDEEVPVKKSKKPAKDEESDDEDEEKPAKETVKKERAPAEKIIFFNRSSSTVPYAIDSLISKGYAEKKDVIKAIMGCKHPLFSKKDQATKKLEDHLKWLSKKGIKVMVKGDAVKAKKVEEVQ